MKRVVFYTAVVIGLIGCGGGGGGSGSGSGSAGGGNDTTIPSSGIYNAADTDQVKYLKVINYARSKARECKNNDGSSTDPSRGTYAAANPLTFNSDLYDAAWEHSRDLAESNTFSHAGSGTIYDTTGSNLGHKSSYLERIEANGYVPRRAGENIAVGPATVEGAVHILLESPGHCANLMNPNYTEVGMAHYEKAGSTYTHYWTQEFGAK